MTDAPTPNNKISNTIVIEKEGKKYNLILLNDENEIKIKCRIDKPLKVYEKAFSKKDLEEICKIFKAYDNINEAYIYILNSIENKQYTFNLTEQSIKIKLNTHYNFEFKEIILPEKEIEINEKIENLYQIQEDLLKEINLLKIEKKRIENNEIEEINVKLTNGSNYQNGYNPFKVYKLNNNIIKLSGLINCNLTQTICTLPENCRPKGRLIFTTMMNSNQLCRIDILSNGNVTPDSAKGNGWLSLDGISFVAGK